MYAETAAPVTTVLDNWTMAAWFVVPALGVAPWIMYNGSLLYSPAPNGWGMLLDATNHPCISYQGVTAPSLAADALTEGQTVFMVATRRSGTPYIYVNGAVVADTRGWGSDPLTPTTRTIIGAGDTSGVYGALTTIDEPAIWNRALTPAEIAELYRIGSGT